MADPKIIADFPVCQCGSFETISQRACAPLKESGKIAKDAFTKLRQQFTPLEQPLTAITVTMVCCSFDICAQCGTERCTRVELMQVPVTIQQGPRPHQGLSDPFHM